MLAAANIPHLHSRPTITALDTVLGKPVESPHSSSFWLNVGIAVALVALGGIFAGLTLGCVPFPRILFWEEEEEEEERK